MGPPLLGQSSLSLPGTNQKAYTGPDTEYWKSTVEEELLNLKSNHVYEKNIPMLEGITPITSKPVFYIKYYNTGDVECYKEVFAPVDNLDSVQTLVALATKYDLELD
ncbi:hypothetical protein PAXRUDRAFT_21304 [Paxillus rubicundulus Ve08.2h10]|uniref:Uncharacterized protein n=1 Tax=Paxillus rubicundulus Ve08.2h10 TaxID=930991 RepID=A0A0D0CC31_9AGAM|nr:hypothetical protein PAXRUDRAFT_21304 [Paxillus rubicundulus Ve08.2h10]